MKTASDNSAIMESYKIHHSAPSLLNFLRSQLRYEITLQAYGIAAEGLSTEVPPAVYCRVQAQNHGPARPVQNWTIRSQPERALPLHMPHVALGRPISRFTPTGGRRRR
jgi:hypothetical protein